MKILVRNRIIRSALALWLALLQAAVPALAQVRSSANFAIAADGIDSGGGISASANYAQRASIGQPFATPPMAGTNYGNQPGLQATITAAGATPDTQVPSVPAGLNITNLGANSLTVNWSASTDNVAVTAYQVSSGGVFQATVNAAATSFSDTGLAASTLYSYTVVACDGSGNCSAQSSPASATTPASGSSYTANLESGFNLIGNSLNITLDVAAIFGNQGAPTGVTPNIVSIWKWNAVDSRWAFYSPQLTSAGIASFAAGKGYELLAVINAGEGYWVNALGQMTLPVQTGVDFLYTGGNFAALPSGFNLIAQAAVVTPSQFNLDVSPTLPGTGVVPTGNFLTLWAWDAVAGTWYFYSPLLEASGGLDAVKSYADSKFYRHFQDYSKALGIGVGFWVNRP